MRMRIKRVKKINDREYELEVEAKTVTTFKIFDDLGVKNIRPRRLEFFGQFIELP